LLNQAVSQASSSLHEYSAVLFIRIDLYLKPDFLTTWRMYDRITFSFIICPINAALVKGMADGEGYGDQIRETIGSRPMSEILNRPFVADMILHVPAKFFAAFKRNTVSLYHLSYLDYPSETVGFMVDTLHDSDSQKGYNWLYSIVNRPEAAETTWFDSFVTGLGFRV
jgi:hypothetical protein